MKLRLFLFGGFRAETDNGDVPALPKKAAALLAYLALNSHAHLRDKLAALLWADTENEHARKSLRQTLFVIRKALEKPLTLSLLHADGESLALNLSEVEVDVLQFQNWIRQDNIPALRQAVALYQGDLLEGLAVTDPSFDEWLVCERERLREGLIDALGKVLSHEIHSGENERAIQTAMRLLAADPLQEPVHCALMRLYARQRRWGAVQRQYQVCAETLKLELKMEPEAETTQLYEQILSGRSAHEQHRMLPATSHPPATEPLLSSAVPEEHQNSLKTPRPFHLPRLKAGGIHVMGSVLALIMSLVLYLGWTAWAGTDTRSIAVLPFQSVSETQSLDDLAMELTDNLITRLSRLNGLRVRSTNTVAKYAQQDQDPITMGRQLGVSAVIEGRVRSRGEDVEVTVQLVEARDGSTLWAREFKGAIQSISSIEDSILDLLIVYFDSGINSNVASRVGAASD